VLSTGCHWRAIPPDLPSKSIYFDLWTYDGTLRRIHHALDVRWPTRAARSPTAPIIDSQSVEKRRKKGLH